MPTAFVRGTQPQMIAGPNSEPFTLTNDGPGPLYVASYSSLSVQDYEFRMAVGQTLGWDGGRELWAITSAGSEASAVWMIGANNTFSPAPDQVTVTGEVTVAGPVEVTGNVGVSGNVGIIGDVNVAGDINITNSVLNVGGTVSTLLTANLLHDATINLSGGVPINIDVSTANQSTVVINIGTEVGRTANLNENIITLTWRVASAAGAVLMTEQFIMSANGRAEYITSVKSPFLRVTINAWGAGALSVPLQIMGTQSVFQESYWNTHGELSQVNNFAGGFTFFDDSESGAIAFAGTTTAAGNGTIFPSHYAGPAQVGWARISAAGSMFVRVGGMGNDSYVYRLVGTGLAETMNTPLILPRRPIYIAVPIVSLPVIINILNTRSSS